MEKKIAELKARLAVATQTCEDFLTEHEKNGVLNEEDKKVYDQLVTSAKNIKDSIARMEELSSFSNALDQPTSTPIVNQPGAQPQQRTKMQLFMDFCRGKLTRTQVVNALQEGTDSEGGYLVPDEFEKKLMEKLAEENVVRGLATVITTSSGDRKIPIVSTEGSASWIAEEGAYTESDDAFSQVVLSAFKAGTLVKVSDELLQDSVFDLEDYILKCFAKRLGNLEESAFVAGNGSGKPTGFMTASGGATGVTTAATDKITSDEILDLIYSLKAPYRRKAKFFMNDALVKYIRQMKDGNGQYIWQYGNISQGQPDTLFGYEVVTSAYAPTISAGAYVIAFGDFEYYWIADRQGLTVKRLEELYAANGQVGFRGSRRVDGKIIFSEAIKLLKMKAS